MSSIMDELKTLQSERTGSGAPGRGETGDDEPPAGGGPVLRTPGRGRRRPPGLVLGVGIAIGALAAALVLPGRGGKPPARDGSTLARATEQPAEETEDAGSVPAAGAQTIPNEAEPEATPDRALAPTEPEVPEAPEARTTEPAVVKPDDADGAVAAQAASEAEESPEGPPDESTRLAAADEAAESPGESGPEAVEEAHLEPVKEAPPPVRVLTPAEDAANKAAIRGLKVFGVLVDQKGVGVYTSEGELRVGSRFKEMDVTEVTSRYVVFESGNKRYRWLLPGRRAAKAGGGAS
jgi:hypothetical protein